VIAMDRILVVEDNEDNLEMLLRRLGRNGLDVVTAVTGEEGIAVAESTSPDLILMDMSLPVLDGWEATMRIKSNGEMNHIPIIALTAHAMIGDRDKAIKAGCDDYDTKPIDFQGLLSKIETLLKS